MSQRRGSQKRRREDDYSDDDDVDEPPKSRAKNDISDLEKEKLVGDLMRYMLFSDLKKQVVNKRDITIKIMKEYAKKRNVTNTVIEEAQKRFKSTFGFEMIELPKTVTKRTGAVKQQTTDKNAASGKYVLINRVKDEGNLLRWDKQSPFFGLLMVILAIIHLNNNSIEQEPLFALLSKLGLDEFNKEHHTLADWVDTVEKQFITQNYLTRTKVPDKLDSKGREVYEYHIGPRSRLEIPKINIVKFISIVFEEELTEVQLQELAESEDESEDEDSGDSE